jgi:hypothetical protein
MHQELAELKHNVAERVSNACAPAQRRITAVMHQHRRPMRTGSGVAEFDAAEERSGSDPTGWW